MRCDESPNPHLTSFEFINTELERMKMLSQTLSATINYPELWRLKLYTVCRLAKSKSTI